MAQEFMSFRKLAAQFDAVCFDSYGVLKNYAGAIDGGPETLRMLRESGKELRILTNDASRSQGQQADRFREIGYTSIRASEIITSGMMARIYLRDKINKGSVAYLGTAASARYVLDAGCPAIPMGEVSEFEDVSALAFLDDEGFDWATDINAAINLLRVRNIPVIVANTDKLYPVSAGRVALATGGIARLVEGLVNRTFMYFGKPDSQMFSYAYEDLQRVDSIPKREVLMVGDTLRTDIIGANKFGIRTCLTLTGNTTERDYAEDIERAGIRPDFVCRSIGD